MINVTEVAAEKIGELLAEEGKTTAGLRVFVQGGGCSGFQYGLMIEEGEPTVDVDRIVESNGRQPVGRRIHDQEPQRQVDLRVRVVVLRLAAAAGAWAACASTLAPRAHFPGAHHGL